MLIIGIHNSYFVMSGRLAFVFDLAHFIYLCESTIKCITLKLIQKLYYLFKTKFYLISFINEEAFRLTSFSSL